jgi:hypothetical protein
MMTTGSDWAAAARRSGGRLEQLGDEGGLRSGIVATDVPNLPLPDHRHRRSSQCSSCRPETTEAEARAGQPFHAPVVLLHNVVQVFNLAQPAKPPQLGGLLHEDRAWVVI